MTLPLDQLRGEPDIDPDLTSLVRAALALGAASVPGWSQAEAEISAAHVEAPAPNVEALQNQIRAGGDPLGDEFTRIRSAVERRPLGQTYTPQPIIDSMLDWVSDASKPARVVDPGTGSGRYLLAAGRRWSDTQLIGLDVDPVATLMARANLAAAGYAGRSHITLGDYRSLELPQIDGQTCFVGNPPYVRHHQITPPWKAWLLLEAKRRGLKASALAGLHVHFFLATAALGRTGDLGAFITAAEWLDTNYGSLVRELLLDGLGGHSVHILEADAVPFADAQATGAITCFQLGSRPESINLRRIKQVDELGRLEGGKPVSRQRLADAARWSPLTRANVKLPEGYVELGEFARVHRGAVTGANSVWVTRALRSDLPEHIQVPAVTKAKDLFTAGERLEDTALLRRVIDLPVDLDELDPTDRKRVAKFLKAAKAAGVMEGYVASNRKAWWSVGLRQPAPILATYMARRPPAFVRNVADARHINIAHGIYPRDPIDQAILDKLADHLRVSVTLGQGRTYAGGLTKFEPREMERLPVPTPELLAAL